MTLGTVRYLLVIEGVADQWVTDSSLVSSDIGDKRRRHEGLSVEGATISEQLNLRESTTEVGGMTFMINAEDDIGLECFAQRQKPITWLTDTATAAATTFTAAKGVGAAEKNDYLHIGTEVVLVTTVSSNVFTVTRQQWDTQQQAHYTNVHRSDFNPMIYMAYDSSAGVFYPPPTLDNRRCYLFRYAEGDSSDGNAVFNFSSTKDGSVRSSSDELIFRGVVSQSPILDDDGITWRLEIASITSLLEQEFADSTAEDYWGITGIYHSDKNGLVIVTLDYDAGSDAGAIRTYKWFGYKDTDEEFIDSLYTNYGGTTLGTNITDAQFALLNGHFILSIHTHASNDCNIAMYVVSAMEGCYSDFKHWQAPSGLPTGGNYSPSYDDLAVDTTYWLHEHAAGSHHFFDTRISNHGKMEGPRSWLGPCKTNITVGGTKAILYNGVDPETQSNGFGTLPPNRLYVDSSIAPYVTDADALWIKTDGLDPLVVQIESGGITQSGTTLYIEVEAPPEPQSSSPIVNQLRSLFTWGSTFQRLASDDSSDRLWPYPLNSTTEIKIIKVFATEGDTSDLVAAIVDNAITANNGSTPFITGSDVNEADIIDMFDGTNDDLTLGLEYLSKRSYSFQAKVSVLDALKEECKLLNACMKLDSTGALTIFSLEMPAKTEAGFTTIDTDSIVTPYGNVGDWIRWSPDLDGIINVVDLSYGYSVGDDNFDEEVKIINHESLATYKNRGRAEMSITPYSRAKTVPRTDDPAIDIIAKNILSFFASDYDVVEIPVSLDLMTTVYCGSKVKVTSSHIPDTSSGTRGVTSRPGLVIGREWPLDASKSIGTIKVRLDRGEPHGGYAPACEVTSAATVSGTTYNLTVTENKFSCSGQDDNSRFSAGYKIKIVEVNSSSPNTEVGSVTTVPNATTVQITLGAAAPWGATYSGTYYLVYDALGNSPVSAQQEYVYVGENDGDLTGGVYSQGHRFK